MPGAVGLVGSIWPWQSKYSAGDDVVSYVESMPERISDGEMVKTLTPGVG